MRTFIRVSNRATVYTRALIESAGLDALAGAWLLVSALLFHRGVDDLFINNIACGGLVMILAFGAFAHAWYAWLPAAIGAWVMISPLVLGFTDNTLGTVNNVVTGIIILIVAIDSRAVAALAHDAGISGD